VEICGVYRLHILYLIMVVTVLLRYAVPIIDTDIWWQMSYGRHFIEHGTLVLNHSIFSWSPSSNETIYCAWLAEIILFVIYELGGLKLLFVVRYFCLFLFILITVSISRKLKILEHPLVFFVILISVLMSEVGVYIKPEIFSYLYFLLMIAVWILIKVNRTDWRIGYLFPILILFWVNSHGAYVFGGLFLGLMFLGELLNRAYCPAMSLEPKVFKHLFFSLMLCIIAIFLTPYGLEYPFTIIQQLAELTLESEARQQLLSIAAYHSIFSRPASDFEFIFYLFTACIITGDSIVVR